MKHAYFLVILLFTGLGLKAAGPQSALVPNPYTAEFAAAYQACPDLPKGVLEAVSWTNTRLQHLDGNGPESCIGIPRAYGVMGLIADGKGYFRNNLSLVAAESGYSVKDMMEHPGSEIMAYAQTLDQYIKLQKSFIPNSAFDGSTLAAALMNLSEIPHDGNAVNYFALSSFVYQVFSFLDDERYASAYHFPQQNYNLERIFGTENLAVLKSARLKVNISDEPIDDDPRIADENGNTFRNNSAGNAPAVQSPDYGPAIWNAAASCNYSSRNGTQITAVTIHDVEGTYAGCISWFQNCAAQVSAHYVARSSDGQITQMVLESNKAWHVGTENPYTIGIEHEGYAAQSGWYTAAMYAGSAALVADICSSNSIDPLRTGWWPWLHTTYYNQSSIPGACTKVKGHQHYPNQTHNDPGPNWDWEYFYRLVNPPPAATTLTAASGNFYDTGGNSANYSDNERNIWTIAPVNATSVTLAFNSFASENTWDYLFIYDGADINAPLIGYFTGTNSPGTITSSGGSLTIEFRSDCATTGTGWDATWSSTISTPSNPDVTAPSTQVTVNGTWQTQDFPAAFTDADNSGGSGLEKSFYQVIDFDGSDWRANNSRGFFSDNFDLSTINPEWTPVVGTWGINNNVLEQSDETSTNTNIYAPLTQNLSNKYLYEWSGKISGTGTNRRAGFHFFCDNPTLTNRGNNYFVWFRVDQSLLEFYKVVNDVFTLENSVAMTVNAGQWYDWKVVYDRTTGEMNVYKDNALIGSWTDTSSPYSTGAYVSFRSGNANWQVDNFKVYRSRYSNQPVTVAVGNCASCEIRYQNTNPSTPAGRIKSLVRDSAYNISALSYQDVNVDWTPPTTVTPLNDGPAADINLTTSSTTLEANWGPSTDSHSGFARFWYAIGTSPCDSDVVAWTSNWGYDTAVATGLTLVNGQTYYFAVRAEDGAGLLSPCASSDGVYVDLTTGISDDNTITIMSAAPNPFDDNTTLVYSLNQNAHVRITLTDLIGREVIAFDGEKQQGIHRQAIDPVSLGLGSGMYLLHIKANDANRTLKLIKR